MKIVELKINDSIIAGFEATALVENPAIELDFKAFNKIVMAEDTFNDYPQGAIDVAKRGIELNKENKMKCATQVGKVRAQQLVNGEKLSLDTIKRMRAFLIRQKDNYDLATKRKDYTACGYISYLLWGGEDALPWAEKKLRQAGEEFSFSLYENVSFDYDGVLTTAAGRALAEEELAKGNKVFVISAREDKEGMLDLTNEIGIDSKNVYAANNNLQKITYVATLNMDRHYDNNEDVIRELDNIGRKFNAEEFILEELLKQELNIDIAGLPNYINEASSGKKNKFAAELAEKQMLIGPLMTPSKLIDRKDDNGEPYQVFFTADTIKQIAYKMMQDGLLKNVNIEHDPKQPVNDVFLVETWLVEDPEHDKSTLYGFKPVVGEWYGIYKVNNDTVWNEFIKTGKVKGFSIEGYFVDNILTHK